MNLSNSFLFWLILFFHSCTNLLCHIPGNIHTDPDITSTRPMSTSPAGKPTLCTWQPESEQSKEAKRNKR